MNGTCNTSGNRAQIQLTNNGTEDTYIPFGLPIAYDDEAPYFVDQLGQYLEGINGWTANKDDIEDNGANPANLVNFYGLVTRFPRNPVIVTKFEVVTENNSQRQEGLTYVNVPYNITDTRVEQGSAIGVDTEVTNIDLVKAGGKQFELSDFNGVFYKLLVGETVKINIEWETM